MDLWVLISWISSHQLYYYLEYKGRCFLTHTLSSVYSNPQASLRDITYYSGSQVLYLVQQVKTWGVMQTVPDPSLLPLCHLIACIPEIISKSWYWVRSLIHVSLI